jgi:sterol 3beta-glucosyltransferase
MRIAVVTFGSRGDTEPPLALADRLAELGHDVRVLVPHKLEEIAQRIGCTAVPLPGDPDDYYSEPALALALRRGQTRAFLDHAAQLDPIGRGLRIAAIGRAIATVDVVISHTLLEDVVVHAAERHRVRLGFMNCCAVWPNGTYPSAGYPFFWMPAWLNRLSYRERRGEQEMLPRINAWRKRSGLAPVTEYPWLTFRAKAPPFLYWSAREILSPPHEFGDNHHFTGAWIPSPRLRAAMGEKQLPPRLVEFLDRGPAPLFVTFGSQPVLDHRVAESLIAAARSHGLRVVFGKGGSVTDVPEADDVIAVEGVDHHALMPRCRAVVHHGGAGTTAAVMRAGIPALVIPVIFDQPFWGRRVTALGVGTSLPFLRAVGPRLGRALGRVLGAEMLERARALAARLTAMPDGASTAAAIISEHADRFPVP